MTPTSIDRHPPEARRALWLLPGIAGAIFAIGSSELLSPEWWQFRAGTESPAVLLAALSGLCLGGWLGRDIYCLHTSQNSLLKDALVTVGTASILAAFIGVPELGWWVWSLAAGDTLVTLFLTTLFAITLSTERTKGVRVYAYARRFVFVRRSDA